MMNWLDLTGASLSLVSTYYFTKSNNYAWIIGMLAILLNTVLYWQKGIYGHVLLELIYFIIMIVGLFKWKSEQRLTVYQLSRKQLLMSVMGVCIAFAVYAFILVQFTPSKMPYWDASTTILCLFAQGLMIYKILLCWMIWFVVDAMIVILQWQNGMPFHSLVTILYLGLAVSGYLRWKKHLCHLALDTPSFLPFVSKKEIASEMGSALANK